MMPVYRGCYYNLSHKSLLKKILNSDTSLDSTWTCLIKGVLMVITQSICCILNYHTAELTIDPL